MAMKHHSVYDKNEADTNMAATSPIRLSEAWDRVIIIS